MENPLKLGYAKLVRCVKKSAGSWSPPTFQVVFACLFFFLRDAGNMEAFAHHFV